VGAVRCKYDNASEREPFGTLCYTLYKRRVLPGLPLRIVPFSPLVGTTSRSSSAFLPRKESPTDLKASTAAASPVPSVSNVSTTQITPDLANVQDTDPQTAPVPGVPSVPSVSTAQITPDLANVQDTNSQKPTCERASPGPTFLFKERQQAGCCGVGQAEYERGGKGDYDQRSGGQGDRGAEADGRREMIGLARGVEVHGLDDAAVVDHGNDAVEQADDDESDKPAAEQ